MLLYKFNCLQLILHNKKNFLKKIILGFDNLMDYALRTKKN